MGIGDWYDGEIPEACQTPLSMLVLQPTPFCNIACSYCYLPDKANRARMSPEVITAVCERLAESGFVSGPLTILWHSGEPLVVGPTYYEAAFDQLARELPPDITPSHSFQTNATLLTREFARLIKARSVNVGVSLDGPAFIHDAHRRTRRDRGTHADVLAGVRILQDYDVPFKVICVITTQTLDHGTELIRFFASIGVKDVGFNVEEVEGAHLISSLVRTNELAERFRAFMSTVYDAASQHEIVIREFEQLRRFVLRDGSIYSTLQNPFSIISVDYRGNFSTFSPELLTDRAERFILGNVLDRSFRAAAATDRYRQMRDDICAGREACRRSCDYFGICGGGSPSNKVYEGGTFRATETTQCRYMRKLTADVLLEKLEQALGLARD